MEITQRLGMAALTALLMGSFGGFVGGARWVGARNEDDFVSRDVYERVCAQNETIAEMYNAERVRNVRLIKKHSPALRLVRSHGRNQAILERAVATQNIVQK